MDRGGEDKDHVIGSFRIGSVRLGNLYMCIYIYICLFYYKSSCHRR